MSALRIQNDISSTAISLCTRQRIGLKLVTNVSKTKHWTAETLPRSGTNKRATSWQVSDVIYIASISCHYLQLWCMFHTTIIYLSLEMFIKCG